jgi:hypothetical protein
VKVFNLALVMVILALAATAPPALSQTWSGTTHVADGLALPRDHQYERYDVTNATYSRVDLTQVPALVRQRVPVYDRTDRVWVFTQKDGLNPRYASTATSPGTAASDAVTGDGLALPRDRQYERYDVGSGTYARVSVDQVPALVRQQVPVYDRTARAWVFTPRDGVNPAYSASAAASPGQGDWGRGGRDGGDWDRGGRGGWDRASGRVVSINSDEVVIREDGGRQVTVNMAQARTRLAGGLEVGDRISVVGVARNADYIDARAVRERGNDVAGRGPDDDWARIHGRVQSIQGDRMTLRADDGRTLDVDLSPVDQPIRQALRQGEGVTVIGYDWTGPDRLRAEYVQQDSSDPARGGGIAPSASPRWR